MTTDGAVGGASRWEVVKRWGSTLAGREALLLLGAAAVVQLLVLHRSDLPSHVVLGGSISLLAAAVVPGGLVDRLGSYLAATTFAGVVAAAVLVELTFYGPFDLVDVSFTAAGALVASEASGSVAAASRADRRVVAVVAVALFAAAWAYRTITGLGPP